MESVSRPPRLLLCLHSDEHKGTECCTSQGPPCLLGPLPFQSELDPSPARSLSAGGRLRDAGLSKNVAHVSLCVRGTD